MPERISVIQNPSINRKAILMSNETVIIPQIVILTPWTLCDLTHQPSRIRSLNEKQRANCKFVIVLLMEIKSIYQIFMIYMYSG